MKTFVTAGAPHLPAPVRVRRVMAEVLLALLPGVAVHVWIFGFGILVQLALATGAALAVEAVALRFRGVPRGPFPGDLSAVVTAVLFVLCIGPLSPWWISALGMLAALGLAKHAHGGLGANLFNPAMVGYAVVLLAFPRLVSQWPAATADLPTAAHAIFEHVANASWDTLASATPLDALRQLAAQGRQSVEIHNDALFQRSQPAAWTAIATAYLLGGLYLLWRRIVSWQAPLGVIGGCVLLTLPFWLFDAELHASPLRHLGHGGLLLAAWFVATDPVSGCTSPRGRLIFGLGVAALTLAIRRWGNHPDGVAFAVLLMNAAAPLIDRVTRPRIYGHAARGNDAHD